MAQQQKMMSFMMIFMGFIFYNMPAGLNLYFVTSSLVGMGEIRYIRRKLAREEEAAKQGGPPKAPRKRSGPSFFERLQAAAENAGTKARKRQRR